MPENYAYVTYPGLETFESCSIGFQHGISPATISLTIPPQNLNNLPLVGDFKVFYNNKEQMTFKDCLLDAAVTSFSQSGNTVQLVLKDFRWKWSFGSITGVYNTKDSSDNVDVLDPMSDVVILNPKKTPQELFEILFEALGVDEYDIDQVPDESRPTVRWLCASPAAELLQLCNKLGVVIVPSPDGSIKILKMGEGRLGTRLYKQYLIERTDQINPPELPENIKIITSPIRYQSNLELEAVLPVFENGPGSGIIYKPYFEVHWYEKIFGEKYPQYLTGFARQVEDQFAKDIYKLYRVIIKKDNFDEGKPVERKDETIIESVKEIEIQSELIKDARVYGEYSPDTKIDEVAPVNKPVVYGSFWAGGYAEENKDNPKSVTTKVDCTFSIKKKEGIVKLSKAVARKTDDEEFTIEPAKLFLLASYFIRDAENGEYERMEEEFEVDSEGKGDLVLLREDLKPFSMSNFVKHDHVVDNFDDIKEKMQEIYDSTVGKFKTEAGSTNVYAGIIPVELNGRIVSVNYQINAGGSITTINIDSDVGTNITPPAKIADRQKEAEDKASKFNQLRDPTPPAWLGETDHDTPDGN